MNIVKNKLFLNFGVGIVPIVVIVVIAIAEIVVMLLLPHIPGIPDSGLGEALADALLLSLLSGPVLWWLLIEPLDRAAMKEKTEASVILNLIPEAIFTIDAHGILREWNPGAEKMLNGNLSDQDKPRFDELLPELAASLEEPDAEDPNRSTTGFFTLQRKGDPRDIAFSRTNWKIDREQFSTFVLRDITDQIRTEQQLARSRKLVSIGQLAAGVAHEINTPAQFVRDNVAFIKESFDEIISMVHELEQLSVDSASIVPAEKLPALLEKADIKYLREEIPAAIHETSDGIARISKIVLALKEFSHPSHEISLIDLNQSIDSTITVASSEWKSVANMETAFDARTPRVPCLPGDFNQVILNLIVNAAHAIEAAREGENDELGTIRITTKLLDDQAEITVEDTGTGMTDDIKERVFDPFFTTKEVGKGTGQGLNIAYNVIVEQLGGTLDVESEPGKGSCFTIRLPIDIPQISA